MSKVRPYLPVALDARKDCVKVANVLNVHPGIVSWALQEVWEQVWRDHGTGKEGADLLGPLRLMGCLGPLGTDARAVAVLVEFGFLEAVGDRYRVRGAATWLLGLEAKSRGGKAAKGNLRQFAGTRAPAGGAPPTETGEQPAQPTGSAGEEPTGRGPAPSPTTQTPTPKESTPPPPTPSAEEPPDAPPPDAPEAQVGEALNPDKVWAFIREQRAERGLPPEMHKPANFDAWACALIARGREVGDPDDAGTALGTAICAYLDDRSITASGHPTAVLMKEKVWSARIGLYAQQRRRRRFL